MGLRGPLFARAGLQALAQDPFEEPFDFAQASLQPAHAAVQRPDRAEGKDLEGRDDAEGGVDGHGEIVGTGDGAVNVNICSLGATRPMV